MLALFAVCVIPPLPHLRGEDEVRGAHGATLTPHPTVSLRKGEANQSADYALG